ncbi:MAG: hypothetical protein ACK2TX_07925 [Anaerolineales bacterium]|jgi:hypothetical protein
MQFFPNPAPQMQMATRYYWDGPQAQAQPLGVNWQLIDPQRLYAAGIQQQTIPQPVQQYGLMQVSRGPMMEAQPQAQAASPAALSPPVPQQVQQQVPMQVQQQMLQQVQQLQPQQLPFQQYQQLYYGPGDLGRPLV